MGGDELFFENGVEGFAVLVGEEDVVRYEGGGRGGEGPVEGDGGAGGGARFERCRFGRGWEEVVVGVDEVGVDDGHVGRQGLTVLEGDACCAVCGWRYVDSSNRTGEMIGYSEALAYGDEGGDDAVETTTRIPDALREL